MFGVLAWHPVPKLPLPWWFRAPMIGAWMNFVLVFFAYDAIATMMQSMFGTDGFLTSPFWIVPEGAVIGFVIDYFATRIGGEGKETAGK